MKIHELSPILWTKSIPETITFYEGVLGFSSQSIFPNFISFEKDDTRIMFVVPQDSPDPFKPALTGSIYLFVDDVNAFWERVKNKASIKSPLADRAYLMKDFCIVDNNGYELVFGQDISERSK